MFKQKFYKKNIHHKNDSDMGSLEQNRPLNGKNHLIINHKNPFVWFVVNLDGGVFI